MVYLSVDNIPSYFLQALVYFFVEVTLSHGWLLGVFAFAAVCYYKWRSSLPWGRERLIPIFVFLLVLLHTSVFPMGPFPTQLTAWDAKCVDNHAPYHKDRW